MMLNVKSHIWLLLTFMIMDTLLVGIDILEYWYYILIGTLLLYALYEESQNDDNEKIINKRKNNGSKYIKKIVPIIDNIIIVLCSIATVLILENVENITVDNTDLLYQVIYTISVLFIVYNLSRIGIFLSSKLKVVTEK